MKLIWPEYRSIWACFFYRQAEWGKAEEAFLQVDPLTLLLETLAAAFAAIGEKETAAAAFEEALDLLRQYPDSSGERS